MENLDNKKRTSKHKFTLIAKNIIISSPEQALTSSLLSSSTTESTKKPRRLPSLKSSKKNTKHMLIANQLKQMKQTTQRLSSSGINFKHSKTKLKNIKIIKTKSTSKLLQSDNNNNNNNNINNLQINSNIITQTSTSMIKKKTKPQQISQWYHFKKTNNLYLFIPNSKYNSSPFINNVSFTITQPLPLPEAFRIRMFRYANMPPCIINSINKANIKLTKNIIKSNIIWKLIPHSQMREMVRQIHPNQNFNHFPTTFQLGRKDNMYRNYRRFNNLFPKDFNYAPNTYLLPFDGERFQNDFINFNKKHHKPKWIVKPANLSRGRGIHILKGEKEFNKLLRISHKANTIPYLISRYISNPHLINNKKYDLRIYVLITSYAPLKIFLYENGLVRFATEDYKRGDYGNIFVHLTNYSINKRNIKYKKNNGNGLDINSISNNNINVNCFEDDEYEDNELLPNETDDNYINDENEDDGDPASKWSLFEYKQYFIKNNQLHIFESIWNGIKDIVTKTIITNKDNTMREIPYNKTTSLFELYGFDIIIDHKHRPWLVEVNVNPSLHCSSPLDLSIKTDLITDIINVVGIKPIHHQIQDVSYSLDGNYKTKLDIYRAGGNLNESESKVKDYGMIRMEVVKSYNGDFWKWKSIYNKDCYKKMIEYNDEEEERMKVTGFDRIFPEKRTIGKYAKFVNWTSGLSDKDVVFWSYLVNKKGYDKDNWNKECNNIDKIEREDSDSEEDDEDINNEHETNDNNIKS